MITRHPMLARMWSLEGLLVLVMLVLLGLVAQVSYAGQIPLKWTNATQNTDGSTLTDLAAVRIEWGTCVAGAFGTTQASYLAVAPATTATIYPTGINPVCVRLFSRNSAGVESVATTVLQVNLPGPLSKPIPLGAPIVLPALPAKPKQ